ncbi:sigma-70 family RNA polymerase sigma factor [[Pseudomonas] carboxydohydrogena]|uniref:Sigma-70 family RNA polymerase sigma factor n=1 Tax=Afipia carboxydohydrogena TaxID=290 RepID=A0ABY8BK79_AFICR|nr:sigma-70 family RNA polymerase sigma factor [[Pseudomonas] carboxydohydrogena]WEF50409.1 sigma-70 family RNA polymerase sigma factor [[Pseudomonas] carboxydohydrogena]
MNDMVHLIEPLIPALRRYARALVRDRSIADDLVQDCLERAVSRWHQRRLDGDPKTWMFSILHNLAVSRFRQQKRTPPEIAIEHASERDISREAHQEGIIEVQDMLRCVGLLPEEHRSVLLLTAVEDLTYAQTADVLGLPVGTVMSRLSRARDSLIELMDGASAEQSPKPYLRRVK